MKASVSEASFSEPHESWVDILDDIAQYSGRGAGMMTKLVNIIEDRIDDGDWDYLSDDWDELSEEFQDFITEKTEACKEAVEGAVGEFLEKVPMNSGHLVNSIIVDTHGYEKCPQVWEVYFSEEEFAENDSTPLTKAKWFYDGDGNPVISEKGRPYVFKAGKSWSPETAAYDYRDNYEVEVDGKTVDDSYVKAVFKEWAQSQGAEFV